MCETTSSSLMTTAGSTTTSTQDITTSSANVISANTLIQAYINTVLGTPDINLSGIPFSTANEHVVTDLPAHQKLARTNAQSYTDGPDSVNSAIVSTLSDIIGYSNTFNSRYNRLLDMANEGNNNPDYDWTSFNQGIQGLINTIKTKESNCDSVITKINAFKALVEQDEQNFNADETIIKATLNGEDGVIDSLQSTIDSVNKAIDNDNLEIAGAGLGEVVGGLMIAVGVLGEVESGGATTTLVVGGLALIGGGVAAQVIAGKDIAAKNQQLKSLTEELSTDQQIATCLLQASNNITKLVNSMANAISALTSLQSGWSSLSGDLQQIVDTLNNAPMDEGTSWLIDDLNASKSDWDAASAQALSLQSNGTLPTIKNDPTVYPVVAA